MNYTTVQGYALAIPLPEGLVKIANAPEGVECAPIPRVARDSVELQLSRDPQISGVASEGRKNENAIQCDSHHQHR